MPTIMIVDDEAIFRRGLRAMIAAAGDDWTIVADARDGYEALELLEKHRPDVVLTDIRMPRMDGLQLQKIARERFPELQVVVISGYEDFSYAQQSMRSGARDYLMKPVEREELLQVLEGLKRDWQARRSEQQHEASLEGQELLQQAADQLVAGIMRGSVQQHHLDLLAQIGIELTEPYFNCMVIKLDKDSMDLERYRQTDPSLFQLYIQQFVQEIIDLRMSGFSFVFSDSEVAALVNLPNAEDGEQRLLEMAESVRRQIKSLSNLTVTIGIGRPVKGFESMLSAFREAQVALLYRLVVGGDKVLAYEQAVKQQFFKSERRKWSWEALEQAINEGRLQGINELVDSVVAELCDHAHTPEQVHQQICKLLIHYYELSEDLGIAKAWLGGRDIRGLLIEICSISSRAELTEQCRQLFGSLTAVIAAGSKQLENDPISTALRYLKRHYVEPITLTDIADRVYLNAAYFSTLFKQRLGKTFIEYMTELRIADAKQRLASTDEKIARLAESTGFSNIRHFNRVFKNETGVTPKKYRERIRQQHKS
ncbi:AraC family transcriptional regulator [Paenibacillus montaniterrae]|uniref:AraC family transcriptional regulator n=1 Tax=Paenibacillus montaniterrae TaxID=429341 RepID=A0A919YPH2_9BACL|nr:response regulator [Paenibacillus montaniterrae]GIP18242.1 AraC family transcriptional regulator [Paenibacillus montaniterrae]